MSLFAPKEKVVYICVTDCERRIIISALADTLKGTRKSYEERET